MTPVEQGGDPKKFDRELVSYALCKRHRLVIAPLQRLLVLAFPVSDAVVLFLQKKNAEETIWESTGKNKQRFWILSHYDAATIIRVYRDI
jgi:hypothetical protein